MALKMIKKMAAVSSASTLELSVSKKDGPVATSVEVGSTGADDKSFTDKQLTPGPASKPLDPANSYNIVWVGAFVKKGSATLKVRVVDASGAVQGTKTITVQGEAKETFFRLLMIP
jgi:hypothetical protein